MSVTQTQRAVGQWSVRLKGNIPKRILDSLTYFGHVAVIPGSVSVQEYKDNLLPSARYVGVYRNRSNNDDGFTIGGVGMESWLGDEEATGDVFETAVVLTGATFAASIAALLPTGGSITAGNIVALPGLYTGTHRWVTPRAAIDYVTELYGATWRVNPNGTLDAGLESDLYFTNPRAILMAKNDGDDLAYKALPGRATMDRDVADFTTRVVVLGEGQGDSTITGSADNPSVPYNDIHGNPVVVKRIVSESETTADNIDNRAEIILNQYAGERPRVSLSTAKYDLKGDVAVGDYIYVYNPANGFEDANVSVQWQGEVIHPVKLQCIELSWPILAGWTVAFRDVDGVWTDLSPWVAFESGETNVVVGQLPRSLTSSAPPGDRPNLPDPGEPAPDTTLPDSPTFLGSSVGSYQSQETNTTKAAIWLQWSTPLNTNASVIDDGDRYEIRFRVNIPIGYKVRWGELESYRWGELESSRWATPVSAPVSLTPEWQTTIVGWGTNQFTLTELTAGIPYEIQVRAVDINGNFSAWSTALDVTTTGDIFPPSVPAAPVVSGNRIAIQVMHTLGRNSGGTFNLEPDTDHLDVHVGGSPSFYCDAGNRVGRLLVTSGMILGSIPAVGSFGIEPADQVYVKVVAVDRSGNRSSASPGATVTALLVDNAHISDLSVSKITAGSITADWILAGAIKTGLTGARAEMTSAGLKLFNSLNQESVNLDSASANIRLRKGRLEVIDDDGNTIVELGRTSDGRYGMRINNPAGQPQIRIGQLTDLISYGLEAINNSGQLVSLSTLAFGIAAQYQNGGFGLSGDGSSSDYVDAPDGLGPAVTVTIGSSGKALVFVGAELQLSAIHGSSNNIVVMSFRITGASSLDASSTQGNRYWLSGTTISGPENVNAHWTGKASYAHSLTNLNPGVHTFTAAYSFFGPVGSGTSINNRSLIVLPY